ncbi:MAG: YhdP family protein [Formivibrio sp.]|nr:YhdP family protein [Formivibrio sp.]
MNFAFLKRLRFFLRISLRRIWLLLLWHSRLLMRVAMACALLLLILAGLWQFWFIPRLEQYRPLLVAELSRSAGVPVKVGGLSAGWDWLRPELALLDVQVPDASGQAALRFTRLEGALSWWTLPTGSLHFSRIALTAPELTVRHLSDGRWNIAGVTLDAQAGNPGFLNWLLDQGGLSITQGRLVVYDERTAGQTLELTQLDLSTGNFFGRRKVSFGFTPPVDIGQRISGDGLLSGHDINRLPEWSGRLNFHFPKVDLVQLNARFAQYVPDVSSSRPIVSSGSGSMSLAINFGGRTVHQLDAELGIDKLRLEQNGKFFDLPSVDAGVHWVASKGREQLVVDARKIDGASGPLARKGRFEYSLNGNERELLLRSISLGGLSAYSAWLPAEWGQKMVNAKLAGDVASLRYAWQGPWQTPTHLRGEADLRGLDLSLPTLLPHLGKLDLMASFTENAGTATLLSRVFQLDWPAQFVEPLTLNHLDAVFNWKRAETGWEVRTNRLALANVEAAVSLSALYRWTGQGLGYIDLKGDITRLPAKRVYAYLPRAVGDDTLAWLKNALRAGQASNGKAELRGELDHFPFADGSPGLFRITTDARDVTLAYADGWPAINAIDGDLRFEGQSMTIHASRAQLFGVQLKDIVTRIPDLSTQQHVLVDGKAEGQTSAFQRFVKESPVRDATQGFLDELKAEGTGQLALKLDVPIADTDKTKVLGRYQFAANKLNFGGNIPMLTQAGGRVDFSETGLKISDASARTLGGGVKLSGANDASGNLKLSLAGDAQLADVAQRFSLPQPKRFSGVVNYQGELAVRRDRYDFSLQSPLMLARIDLPRPMGKSAGESRGFSLKVSGDPQRNSIMFTYGRVLQGNLEQKNDKPYTGLISLGGDIPPGITTSSKGVQLVGGWPEIDVATWQSLMASNGDGQAPAIVGADLAFDRLFGWGRRLSSVHIKAEPTAQGWQVDLASAEAAGSLTWRGGTRSGLTGRLQRLYLPLPTVATAPNEGNASAPAQSGSHNNDAKPALDLNVSDFRYKDSALGQLVVNATPQGDGWQLNQVTLTNPDGRFSLTGQWLGSGANEKTTAKITLNSEDSGKLLTRLGYPDTLRRAPAVLTGEGSWHGAPFSPDLSTVQGKLHIDVQSGQFAKIEPGAGRLLSVISLQSLPRRIKLDFRDVFSEGLEFDSILGDAVIEKGVVHTDNLAIDGPAAKIRFKGEANLSAGTQDLHVRIAPLLGDAASLAVGVVNPIAGVAAFALQRLFKDPLGQLVSYEYHITGDMLDPQVRKVSSGSQ